MSVRRTVGRSRRTPHTHASLATLQGISIATHFVVLVEAPKLNPCTNSSTSSSVPPINVNDTTYPRANMTSVDCRITRVPTFFSKSPRTKVFVPSINPYGSPSMSNPWALATSVTGPKYCAASLSPGYDAALSVAIRIEPFTSSARAFGGRENAARSTRPALPESVSTLPASAFAPSSSRAFICSVRNTHPAGILHVNPNSGLRYTSALMGPASGWELARECSAACLDFEEEEEDEEEGGVCARAKPPITRQLQRQMLK